MRKLYISTKVCSEKYIVSVAGTFAATWLIPISLLLLIGYLVFRKKWLQTLGIRILLLSALITLIVPLSVTFSKSVENAYDDDFRKASEAINLTDDSKTSESNKENSKESSDSNDSKNVWEIVQDTINDVGEKAADAAESVKLNVSEITDKVVNAANNFVELVAIMILTSFLVPLITFILFLWALKLIFKASTSISGPGEEYKLLTNKMNEIELKLKK